ncbi:helix-turn-helix transcriptional regulator [Ochrobactrum sp. XJ1]|nr:helix-turn-helix transcriptional regulator [Ochrobactrum sp. XJ1]
MVTPNSKIRSRLDSGADLALKSALQLAQAEGLTLDALLGRDQPEPAPAAYREKPLYFVARHMNISQQELADRSGASLPAIHHAFRGDDVRLSTVISIAEALNWPVQDVAKMILAPVETLDSEELARRLDKIELSIEEKAKALKVTGRTLRRWLQEGRPIPAGIKNELDNLGW